MAFASKSPGAFPLRLTIGVALALLAACANYEPAPLEPAQLYRQYQHSDMDADAIRQELEKLAPGYGWDGEHLDRLVLLAAALEGNPAIEQSRASATAAAAEAVAAEVRPGPTLGLTSEYAFNAPEPSPWLLGVAAGLPLDLGARREARIDIASLQARIALVDYLDTVWSVRSSLQRALAGYLLAEQEASTGTELVELRERQAEAMRHRVAEGDASQFDLSQVLANLAADRLRTADAQAQAARSLVQLAAAVGVPAGSIDAESLEWPLVDAPREVPPDRFLGCSEAAVVARPTVMRASLAYDQAEAALKSAVAAQYPTVNLGTGYIWERGLKKLPFSLGLALPPLDLNRAAIAAAEARREEAGRALEAAVAGAANSLDLALSDYRAAWRLLDQAREQATIAADEALRADRALRLGAFNRIEWSSAQATARTMALDALAAVRRVRAAEAALEDALRQPLDGPELVISGAPISDRESTCAIFSPHLP